MNKDFQEYVKWSNQEEARLHARISSLENDIHVLTETIAKLVGMIENLEAENSKLKAR